jgi:two-component sensor histidine kinase
MALHELATNAAKYGALSTALGKVTISWRVQSKAEGDNMILRWVERGGPRVTPPIHKGFGHVVMADIVARALDGTVDLDFTKEGLTWTLVIPARHARDLSRNTCESGAVTASEGAPASQLAHTLTRSA